MNHKLPPLKDVACGLLKFVSSFWSIELNGEHVVSAWPRTFGPFLGRFGTSSLQEPKCLYVLQRSRPKLLFSWKIRYIQRGNADLRSRLVVNHN